MKLMTKELEKRFKQVGSQEGVEDPIILAKYFYPAGAATWYATEYDPATELFFGYVTLFGAGAPENEWGSFSLQELKDFTGSFGLGIERDLWFGEKKFSEVPK